MSVQIRLLIEFKFKSNFHFPNRLSQVTKVIFAFAIFISYALQCFVPVNIIWENYVSDKIKTSPKSSSYQLLLRVVITIITCKIKFNINIVVNAFNNF